MHVSNSFGIDTKWRMVVFDVLTGEVEVRDFKNLVTTEGKEWIIDKITEDTDGEITYVGWGSGDATPVVGNTSMNTPVTTNLAEDVEQLTSTKILVQGELGLSEGNGNTIREVSLKANDSGTPFLLHSTDFSAIAKTDRKIIYLETEIEIT